MGRRKKPKIKCPECTKVRAVFICADCIIDKKTRKNHHALFHPERFTKFENYAKASLKDVRERWTEYTDSIK